MTGYAVIDVRGAVIDVVCHGCFKVPASLPFPERLARIADLLAALILERHPDEAAVEDIFHAVNTRSALQLAHVRGAILVELARRRLDPCAYAPRNIKKALTGVGSADKVQVRLMVERLARVRLEGSGYDASDALAVAICHAHSRRGIHA